MHKSRKDSTPTYEQLADWVSPEEARRFIKVGRSSMYGLLVSKRIPAERFGRLWKIPKEALKPAAK